MRFRRALLALVALTMVVTGTGAVAGPAHAGGVIVTRLELNDRGGRVTIGDVRKAVERALKQTVGLPEKLAVASDNGKTPSPGQIDTLLDGKSTGGITLYRTVGSPTPTATVGDVLEGTPLPAIVTYRTIDARIYQKIIRFCAPGGGCHVTVVVIAPSR